MTIQFNTLTAAQLGRCLAGGECSAVEATQHCFEQIKAQSDNPVFLRLTEERAMREAQAADARYRANRPLSPLDGVPIAWKALYDLEGLPTSAGSKVYRDMPLADADALVVQRLSAAGMICLGMTNMTEFAYSGLGLNPHYGTPRNPFDPDRIPGGSSSGSGVAVAASMAFCSMGSDTGGSIRIPASFNGLVGYKPSAGRHNKQGVFDLS
ncbi:MAG: amidase family protein, partial [Pseudomonadota bacterium]